MSDGLEAHDDTIATEQAAATTLNFIESPPKPQREICIKVARRQGCRTAQHWGKANQLKRA